MCLEAFGLVLLQGPKPIGLKILQGGFWMSVAATVLGLDEFWEVEPNLTTIEKKFLKAIAPIVTDERHACGKWGGHCVRVCKLTYSIAYIKGLEEEWCRRFLFAGLLHDMGKLSPELEELFSHERVFTSKEKERADQHDMVGAQMATELLLEEYGYVEMTLWHIKAGQLTHHQDFGKPLSRAKFQELWPNKPYEETMGHGLPYIGRILKVADTYDSLISDRGYKYTWSPRLASLYLLRHSGTKFDPRLVQCLVDDVLQLRIRFEPIQVWFCPIEVSIREAAYRLSSWLKKRLSKES